MWDIVFLSVTVACREVNRQDLDLGGAFLQELSYLNPDPEQPWSLSLELLFND